MSEITSIRPWTHIHQTTKETEYFLDVHRIGTHEPDEWQFGTNCEMWEAVITAMKATLGRE